MQRRPDLPENNTLHGYVYQGKSQAAFLYESYDKTRYISHVYFYGFPVPWSRVSVTD